MPNKVTNIDLLILYWPSQVRFSSLEKLLQHSLTFESISIDILLMIIQCDCDVCFMSLLHFSCLMVSNGTTHGEILTLLTPF